MTYSEASEILGHCNHTEQYQAARALGMPALPSMGKSELVDMLILGPPEGLEVDNPHDPWRYAIMGFLRDPWDKGRAQLGCPAKSGELTACFNCTDAQVTYCLVDNAGEEFYIRKHLVQLKRKPPCP